MDEVIAAMGMAIEDELHADDGWEVGTPQLRAMCNDFATAAYNAMRAKLVPVGICGRRRRPPDH